jgi:hypothetical protein
MRAEYYADIYRRYQTYVRKYGDNPIFKDRLCGRRTTITIGPRSS